MLLNLNPPPMPTPDTARSVESSARPDDDPLTADLFAQLVAAAALANPAPIVATPGEALPQNPTDHKKNPPHASSAAADLSLVLAAMPAALPLTAAPTSLRVPVQSDETPVRAPTHSMPARIERSASLAVERDTARTSKHDDTIEPLPSRVPVGDVALREQFAAALAARPAVQPAQFAALPGANDTRGRDISQAPPPVAPQPAAPLAAAIAAAVERERVPERAPHERASALDAPALAQTPSSAPLASHGNASPPAQVTIDTPVGAPGFGDEVATKLAHVVLKNDRAELRLSPAELGPVDIRIDFKSDSASLTIVAAQPATRDALEQALPQLRDALAAQGIALGQAAIHDGRGEPGRRDAHSATSAVAASRDNDATPAVGTVHVRLSDRLVDTFA